MQYPITYCKNTTILRHGKKILVGVTLQLLQFEKTLRGWVVQWGNGTVTL